MSYSSAIGSIVDDLVESEHDDSFQKEVQNYTIFLKKLWQNIYVVFYI